MGRCHDAACVPTYADVLTTAKERVCIDYFVSLGAVALMSGFLAAPDASAQQSVNFYIGGFTPRAHRRARRTRMCWCRTGFSSRHGIEMRGIDIGEFNNVTVGGEWLFGHRRATSKAVWAWLLSEVGADRVHGSRAHERDRHRADAQASNRSVHRDDPVPAARQRPPRFSRTSARASACTAGATARPGSSSTPRTTSSPAISSASGARDWADDPRRRARADRTGRRRLRNPAPVG